MSENKNPIASDRYLQFNLGAETFAIPLLQVREVIGFPETTPIPFSPNYFVGLMNLRGQVISVLDLRKKLSVKPLENQAERAVVILDVGGVVVGCVVDSINRVLNLQSESIQPASDVEGNSRMEFLMGIVQVESRLTAMLDIYKLLNVMDMNTIQSKVS